MLGPPLKARSPESLPPLSQVPWQTHCVSTYADNLLNQLAEIEAQYVAIIESSEVRNVDPNRAAIGVVFVGAQEWDWVPSDASLERARKLCLDKFEDWFVRFNLLFPDPLPRVHKVLKNSSSQICTWLRRAKTDHSISPNRTKTTERARKDVANLRDLVEVLPNDEWKVRVVPDTNALVDNPDLGIYTQAVGRRYLMHVMPVVMRELDDLKRSGRTDVLRENARRADRRLKGYRTNGDVRSAVRVAGEAYVRFEYADPQSEQLPSWIDLSVPDDRFLASVLLLQSAHPGSAVTVVTSDMNMQTKLAAAGLPFIEHDD